MRNEKAIWLLKDMIGDFKYDIGNTKREIDNYRQLIDYCVNDNAVARLDATIKELEKQLNCDITTLERLEEILKEIK